MRLIHATAIGVSLAILLTGCDQTKVALVDDPDDDIGRKPDMSMTGVDAGAQASPDDAGQEPADAGAVDAGRPNAGVDAGRELDAGRGSDAGQPRDAGRGDAGSPSDAGAPSGDAGSTTITPPNFKVAVIGDTDDGSDYRSVLALVKAEGAQAMVVAGDYSYDQSVSTWFTATDNVLGASFPLFMAMGNHDSSAWTGSSGYAARLKSRLAAINVVPDDPNLDDQQYAVSFKGLGIVTLGYGSNANAAYLDARLAADKNLWKLCNWHKNQKAMQVGGKSDEMGWDVYETCRKHGAIIITGHEHSYSRTKTLTSMTNQTVDSTCSSPTQLCVGPNRTFVVVSGLGGVGIRDQTRCLPDTKPYGCKGEWASIYSENQNATFGALFLTFNVDGNPKKASGYFKAINGQTIDTFTILKD